MPLVTQDSLVILLESGEELWLETDSVFDFVDLEWASQLSAAFSAASYVDVLLGFEGDARVQSVGMIRLYRRVFADYVAAILVPTMSPTSVGPGQRTVDSAGAATVAVASVDVTGKSVTSASVGAPAVADAAIRQSGVNSVVPAVKGLARLDFNFSNH